MRAPNDDTIAPYNPKININPYSTHTIIPTITLIKIFMILTVIVQKSTTFISTIGTWSRMCVLCTHRHVASALDTGGITPDSGHLPLRR